MNRFAIAALVLMAWPVLAQQETSTSIAGVPINQTGVQACVDPGATGEVLACTASGEINLQLGSSVHPLIVTTDMSFRPDGTNEALGIVNGTDQQVILTPTSGTPTAVVPLFGLKDVAGNTVCNFYPNQGDGDTLDKASFYCEDPDATALSSVVMGLRASCSSTSCTAIGPRDVTSGQKSVCISGSASSQTCGNDSVGVGCGGGVSSICIGESSNACGGGSKCVVIANDTDTTDTTAPIPMLILMGGGFDSSENVSEAFAFGFDLRDDNDDVTVSNSIRFGGEIDQVDQMILGVEFDPAPNSFRIRTTNAEGTDISTTGDLVLQPSAGTGTGTGADFIVEHCPAGGTGSTVNSCVAAVTVDGETGVMLVKKHTADPCSAGLESGIFYNDTSNYWCGCDGTNDVQLHSPATACF